MGTKGNPATVNQLNAPELMGDGILYLILIIRSTCHRLQSIESCPFFLFFSLVVLFCL